MTVRNKFSPLGKPGIDSYPPETVLFENRPANEAKTQVELPILEGVYELMCCSGGGGQWCYLGCNQGAAGSFFKGVVYFPEAKTLQIQVGGGTSGYAHGGMTPISPTVSTVPADARLTPAARGTQRLRP